MLVPTILGLASLVFSSCGADSHHARLEGRLLNINTGEFYVYSPDGAIEGIDTLKVQGSRFSKEISCESEGTLIIVFPNFYEEPIFVAPGNDIEIKGDASHLKQLVVKGSKNNKLMTAFREQIANSSPAEIRHYAELFIEDNPESIVSSYMLLKYFIQDKTIKDYSKAIKLAELICKEQPRNGLAKRVNQHLRSLAQLSAGKRLPSFSARDINGKAVTSANVSKGLWLIYSWASWDGSNRSTSNIVRQLKESSNGKLNVLGISVDASIDACKNYLRSDSLNWQNICTGQMFDTPILRTLAITTYPSTILVENGKIIGKDLSRDELENKIKK